MKTAADKKTGELLPDHDLAGERPRKQTQREQVAVRLANMRERRGLKAITVNLPVELVEEFHARRQARGHTANQAFEILLRTQYLRKR